MLGRVGEPFSAAGLLPAGAHATMMTGTIRMAIADLRSELAKALDVNMVETLLSPPAGDNEAGGAWRRAAAKLAGDGARQPLAVAPELCPRKRNELLGRHRARAAVPR